MLAVIHKWEEKMLFEAILTPIWNIQNHMNETVLFIQRNFAWILALDVFFCHFFKYYNFPPSFTLIIKLFNVMFLLFFFLLLLLVLLLILLSLWPNWNCISWITGSNCPRCGSGFIFTERGNLILSIYSLFWHSVANQLNIRIRNISPKKIPRSIFLETLPLIQEKAALLRLTTLQRLLISQNLDAFLIIINTSREYNEIRINKFLLYVMYGVQY